MRKPPGLCATNSWSSSNRSSPGTRPGSVSGIEDLQERKFLRHRFKLRTDGSGSGQLTGASLSQRYELVMEPDNTDLQNVHIRDTRKGLFLEEVLRAKWPSVIWDSAGSFVYAYGRDGRLGGATALVRRHKVGTPQSEDVTLLEAKSGVDSVELMQYDGKIWVVDMDCPGYKLSRLDPNSGDEDVMFETRDNVLGFVDYRADKFWFVSFVQKDMGEIVTFDTVTRKFGTVVTARSLPLDRAALIDNYLYLTYVRNAAHELRRFDLDTGKMYPIDLPRPGQVEIHGSDEVTGEMLFRLHTYTTGEDEYAYNPKTGRLRLVQQGYRPDFELTATRISYTPVKGWTAPIWVIKRKDTGLSPTTPMYLTGYGGFRANILPGFHKSYLPWLKRGGAVAVVTLPGGVELGEAWHRLGMLKNKRNVFDACAAAAKALIAGGWTNRQKIALSGASNGGLLAAATAYYYPTLFRATVPLVGVLDMTRFPFFTSGVQWTVEYGNPELASDFRFLLSISPYHRLLKGAKYPAALVVTSDQDDRVFPAHSYKFAALLQSLPRGTRNLLHVAHGTGHNYLAAKPEENARTSAIMWSFIMQELCMN